MAWSSKPMTLTMDDLKKLPTRGTGRRFGCVGNERKFYEPHLPGAQWAFGSYGNGHWAGVRLRDILQEPASKARYGDLFDGADVPCRKMPDFQRTITTARALDPDSTLLALTRNERPAAADATRLPLRA